MTTPTSLPGIPRSIITLKAPTLGQRSTLQGALADLQALPRHFDAVQQQIATMYSTLSQRVNELIMPMVVKTITGVAPSVTLGTYGTQTVVNPPTGYASLLAFPYLAVTSGGTFGAETLTVRVTFTFNDASTTTGTKTFVAAGNETAFSSANIFALLTDALYVTSVAVDCQSTINNSTATGGMKVAAWVA